MLKCKDKKWYQLWGQHTFLSRPQIHHLSSVSSFSSCIFLYLSLSVMSRDCHSRSAQRHVALPRAAEGQRRQEGKEQDRRNASGWDFLPFSEAVEFPLLKTKLWILSCERRPFTGAAPCLIPSSAMLSFSLPFCLQRNYRKDILGNEWNGSEGHRADKRRSNICSIAKLNASDNLSLEQE